MAQVFPLLIYTTTNADSLPQRHQAKRIYGGFEAQRVRKFTPNFTTNIAMELHCHAFRAPVQRPPLVMTLSAVAEICARLLESLSPSHWRATTPCRGMRTARALRVAVAMREGSVGATREFVGPRVLLVLRTLPRATGVSRALRARNPKKVCKESPGAFQPGAPKNLEQVSKKSEKSGKSLENACSGLFETFSRLFGAPGPEAPGDSFQTFLGIRARRARETPVARGEGSQFLFFVP